MITITKVDIYEKNQVVPSGAFPVMMLEVPDFPPFAGNISNIVNPVHAAVVACNKFDDVGGWAFCDLHGNEKTAIGEALVECGAKFGAWYMATWYMTEMDEDES